MKKMLEAEHRPAGELRPCNNLTRQVQSEMFDGSSLLPNLLIFPERKLKDTADERQRSKID
jgi:hypothetical protein